MEYDQILQMTSEALLLCLLVSMPAILVSAVVGLLVTFVQAITSLQDPTVSQGIKMVAVVVAMIVSAPWGASVVLQFAERAMRTATT